MAISITCNEKDALTALATVSLTGHKLPRSIPAKGETIRSEVTQLEELGDQTTDHSPNGVDDGADDDLVSEMVAPVARQSRWRETDLLCYDGHLSGSYCWICPMAGADPGV
jgi:hypothetical protein